MTLNFGLFLTLKYVHQLYRPFFMVFCVLWSSTAPGHCLLSLNRKQQLKFFSKCCIQNNNVSERDDLQHVRAVVRFVQQSSLHDKPQYLLIGHALIGLLGQGGYFPQHHTKGPARGKQMRKVKIATDSAIYTDSDQSVYKMLIFSFNSE